MGVAPAGGSVPLRRPAAATKVTTYVGRVASLDASLAVVTDGKHAFGYLCDSAELSEWLRGDASKQQLNLSSANGALLTIRVTGKTAEGLVALADGTLADVTLRKATGDAGLFRQEEVIDGVGYAAGWVVLPNGDVDGQVSLANITGARVLPVPLRSAEVAPADVVGAVAPTAIAEQFPPTPPAETQVTVVPFSATTNTQTGTSGTDTTPEDNRGVVTTTKPVPLVTGPLSCQDRIDGFKAEIAALEEQLDSGNIRLLKRRAVKAQIQLLSEMVAFLTDAQKNANPNVC
ncbi:MAG: hypothetical protein MUP97_04720 [Acidimicrobiia bacterium]|nr:hypothetical protein [Acidimicrobiia bacterium]